MKFASTALLFVLTMNFAVAAPVRVQDFKQSKSAITEVDEPTIDDIQEDLAELKRLNGDEDDLETARINWNPAQSAGKIIIKANISTVPMNLQVFRQNSANPNDLSPINVFDNGASNSALISPANSKKFQNCGKSKNKPCITPTGNFNIDKMELMHHSKHFNNAPMPHSMFFIGSVGIAMHGATPGEFNDLGKPASHGCIRIHPTNAALLYALISKEGGTKSGAVVQIH